MESARDGGKVGPVRGRQTAVPHLLAVDARLHGDDTFRELFLRHLEGEEQHLAPLLRDVRREVQGETRLTHGRTGADDDEVGPVQAGDHRVEVSPAGGGTQVLLPVRSGQVGQVRDDLVEQDVTKARRGTGVLALTDIEDLLLREVEDHFCFFGVSPRFVEDLVRGLDEGPLHELVFDDLRVGLGVLGGREQVREFPDVLPDGSGVSELARVLQFRDDGNGFDDVAAGIDGQHGIVDSLVFLPIEELGPEAARLDAVEAVRVEEQAGQHGALRLKAVGQIHPLRDKSFCHGAFPPLRSLLWRFTPRSL